VVAREPAEEQGPVGDLEPGVEPGQAVEVAREQERERVGLEELRAKAASKGNG